MPFYLFYSVKYLFSISLFLCYLLPSANAQQEHWDTYIANFDGKAGSVLVDMGLQPTAPDKRYPYLVITGPRTENCSPQGLPYKEDIPVMEGMLDATTIFLTGITAKVLAGTLTYNCERVNYYYVKDTMGIRNAIGRMYERSYRDHSYVIKIKPDPEWKTYRTFLYPDEQTQIWMENNRLITEMKERGDSLTTERFIRFNVSFKSAPERDAFLKFAEAEGYSVERLPVMNLSTYAATISRYGFVKMDYVNPLVSKIKAELIKYNGTYNGWKAPKISNR